MDNLGKYLVNELIKEIESITDYVVVYAGRFQPFHKGHFTTYQHLVKKFGKDNVYIGTSDKTDKLKSPFNFKEKQIIMRTMFGIPTNKIVQIKNPYAPVEILKKFDENSTAFITVVGEKDEARLGGKYFTPYTGNLDAGYKDKGYVYTAPAQPNAISGTDVRNWLGSGDIEDRRSLFTKAYPKANDKIFKLITSKLDTLNESVSADPGEPDVGYYVDGARRIINGAKPENWFKQGGYKQLDKPKSDNMRGKGKTKDKESQFRKVTFQLKGVTQPVDGDARVPYQVDKWKNVTPRSLKKKQQRYYDLGKIKEQIFIPKEFIEQWIDLNLTSFLNEISISNSGGGNLGKDVDDGPNLFFPNYDVFDAISKKRAEQIGYTVFAQIMSGELEDYYEHPIYPNGPVKAVTPFPAGIIGKTTATNQKDLFGDEAYDKWYNHVTRSMGLVGYQIVKDFDKSFKDMAIQSADNIKKVAGIERIKDTVIESGMGITMGYPSKEQLAQKQKERDRLRKQMDSQGDYYQPVGEDISIPVNIGDTILTGKFKNKKVIVKSIGTDERGMPTINGKKVVNFRLMAETVDDEIKCSNCSHSWKMTDTDTYPYLCHKCGWDSKAGEYNYIELNKWKNSMKNVNDIYNESIDELIKEFQSEGLLNEIPMDDLRQIDAYADKQLNPFDVVLTDKHFIDRLSDPRNKKPISSAELTGFFKRLSRKKNEFAEFLKKYGEIVAKDNRTKINIPFMKQANKAIAKTIMRKDDFKTPSPELKFEIEKVKGGLSSGKSLSDIANKHKVSLDDIKSELRKGVKVEMEHTTDTEIAKEIAMDHLFENPKYYTKLATIEEANFNPDIVPNKNVWYQLDNKEVLIVSDNIIDLIKTAYSSTKFGSFVTSKSDLTKSIFWKSIDNDTDPHADAIIFGRKSPNGIKIQGIGHDGDKNSKDDIIKKLVSILKTPGYWIEASDALEHTLYKNNIPYVSSEKVGQSIFPNTNLKMIGDKGKYERTLENGTKIRETIFGRPKVSVSETDTNENLMIGYPNQEWINNHNKKLKKLRTKLDAEKNNEYAMINTRIKKSAPMRGLDDELTELLKNMNASISLDELRTPQTKRISKGGTYVTCMECGTVMKQIQYRHLQYKHGMSMDEYKDKYPTAILVSESAKNMGNKNPMKNEENKKIHKAAVNTKEYKNKISESLKGKNIGNVRIDNIERNQSTEFRKKVSEGVKNSYITNPKLKDNRSETGKKYGFGNTKTLETMYNSGKWTRPENKDEFQLYSERVRRLSDLNYQKFFNEIENAKQRGSDFHLDHKYSIKEAFDNNIPVEVVSHYKNLEVIGGRLNESKGSKSSIKLNELINDIQNSTNPLDTRTLLLCGGAYGHMNHPFDVDINLTFGQLKDIVKKALNGELELTREKCIAGDTRIHTEKNGDITIAEFVDTNIVDKVLSFNEETGENEYMDVMVSFNNDTTDEWLEIELEDGKTIQVTPNHRMYVEGIGYVEAKDLTEDMELKIV